MSFIRHRRATSPNKFECRNVYSTNRIDVALPGFRAFCDSYDQILEEESVQFRIADMSSGKAVDDGYRGIHVYYQKSGKYYPIEIQFNTLFDRQLNNWLHDYLYKKDYPIEEIAEKVGYKTASAVHKRIAKIATAYEDFVTAEYQKYLG